MDDVISLPLPVSGGLTLSLREPQNAARRGWLETPEEARGAKPVAAEAASVRTPHTSREPPKNRRPRALNVAPSRRRHLWRRRTRRERRRRAATRPRRNSARTVPIGVAAADCQNP